MDLYVLIFGLALTLAIPSGFGRSRIRRNCGYTLLVVVIYPLNFSIFIFVFVLYSSFEFKLSAFK